MACNCNKTTFTAPSVYGSTGTFPESCKASCGGSYCADDCTPCIPTDSNCPSTYERCLNASYLSLTAFNVPRCGQEIPVRFETIKNIFIGSYLFNDTYGYFEVTKLDTANSTLVLNRDCSINGQENLAGHAVPLTTRFTLVPYPSKFAVSNECYVAENFTAPTTPVAGSHISCTTVQVTTSKCFAPGQWVSITAPSGDIGYYYVSEINTIDGPIITLCNAGAGFPPGALIQAVNPDTRQYQYPIRPAGEVISLVREISSVGETLLGTSAFYPTYRLSLANTISFWNPSYYKYLHIMFNTQAFGSFENYTGLGTPTAAIQVVSILMDAETSTSLKSDSYTIQQAGTVKSGSYNVNSMQLPTSFIYKIAPRQRVLFYTTANFVNADLDFVIKAKAFSMTSQLIARLA